MHNLGWGLYMTVAGMGTVFLLLIVLMVLLMAIGRADRPRAAAVATPPAVAPSAPAPSLTIGHDGLTDDELAAIAIAVITHAQVRRQQAAPAMRTHQPGSLLHASRWVAIGRGNQTQPWRRS